MRRGTRKRDDPRIEIGCGFTDGRRGGRAVDFRGRGSNRPAKAGHPAGEVLGQYTQTGPAPSLKFERAND